VETLGPVFMVYRDKVQKELRLSDEQKRKLEKRLRDTQQSTAQVFRKLAANEPQEREREVHAYREKA
jgi:hypothetical protein